MGVTSAKSKPPRSVLLNHQCDLTHLHPVAPPTELRPGLVVQAQLCCQCGRLHAVYSGLDAIAEICGEFVHLVKPAHSGIVVAGEQPKLELVPR